MAIAKKIAGLLALTSAFAFAGPVSHFGRLMTCNPVKTYLCGEKTNAAVQVKGPSLYWSTGLGTAFYNETAINWFVNYMNIGVVRAAMAIKYWDAYSQSPISMSDGNKGPTTDFGYLSTGSTNKANQKAMIEAVIQAAIDNDIYVIVDWHSHVAHNETSEAVAFFTEMATKYKDVPNIIWEIYNEPTTDAGTINNYAKQVASAIRATGNKNLIVVGSTKWSSYPKSQSQQAIGAENVAYTFHFYAAEHSLGSGNDAGDAATYGVPMFVTEWGTTAASGDGDPNEYKTSTWTTWMDDNKLSSCNWFAGADAQGSAMFKSGTIPSTMSTSNLTISGNLFKTYMSKQSWTKCVPNTHPFAKSFEASVPDGSSKTFSSTELNLLGSITKASSSYGTVTFTANSISLTMPTTQTPEYFPIQYEVTRDNVTIKERILVKVTNRRPALKDTTISVSYKAPSKFTLLKLGAVDPETGKTNSLTLKGASADVGTASVSGDTVVYEPAGEGVATVKYQVSNANGTVEGILTLNCENQAPSIYTSSRTSIQNTESAVINMHLVRGKDADGDSIWFKAYTIGQFPGTINVVAPDTLVYTPEPGKIGTVTMLAVLTDGKLDSKIGPIKIVIGGYGTSFDGTIPVPTEIEDYEPPEQAIYVFKDPVHANLNVVGTDVLFSLPQSAEVSLAVFDVKGHCVATLAKEKFSAGSHRVSLKNESLPKGMFIARMQYGSQVKSVRFINK